MIAVQTQHIQGNLVFEHISTCDAERQNLTTRMAVRRFTRLSNAFGKTVGNPQHAVSPHFTYCNFCRIHKPLHVTPAMEAKITPHLWTLEEIVWLLDRS
jgi:hypothetical protein